MEDGEGDEEQMKEGPRMKSDRDDEREGERSRRGALRGRRNKMPALTNLHRLSDGPLPLFTRTRFPSDNL